MMVRFNINQNISCINCINDDDIDPISNIALFLQNLLLVISNLFLIPAIYLSLKCKYYAEAVIYFLTMLCSSFYHLCDNGRLQYCIIRYDVLQFCDFYSAILTLWATAILLSDLPYTWRSALHLSGSLFFAGLLQLKTTGFWSFVVPGFFSCILLLTSWSYQYFYENRFPTSISYSSLIPAAFLSFIGAILFASQTTKYVELYSYTHSGWHICMALAITFLLPKNITNRFSLPQYSDQVCVLSIANSVLH